MKMTTMKSLMVVAACALASGHAQAFEAAARDYEAVPITQTPFVITQPGRYYITGVDPSLIPANASYPAQYPSPNQPLLQGGIGIRASNVILDLNGWQINGPITVYQASNVMVENGSFAGSQSGVVLSGCSLCTVRNISGRTGGVAILDVNGWSNKILNNNVASGSAYGVYINNSSLSVVEDNQIYSGQWGVVATGSYAPAIKGNTITAPYGIYMPNQYGAHADNTFAGAIYCKVYGEPTATN
jgi:parallel beta-helix repeat protein